MSLYRGAGGASDATDDSTVNAVAGYASAAATSADSAAASASDADSAASAAASSASSASSSASGVAINATNASNSASLASTYAGQASSSKDAAAASAVTASDKAGLASSSESNASSSASTASTKASEAVASALEASGFADDAAASAADALAIYGTTEDMEAAVASASDSAISAASDAAASAASAVDAADSEALAYEHEQNAAEWATVAQGAANNSQAYSSASAAARDAALAALDNFDDRYLGQKAADPVTDNDGETLIAGALYFNNQDNVMKVYEGSIWVSAYASLSGALLAVNNLNDVSSASLSRTNLGLGTAAVTDSTAYATAAQGTSADTSFGWGNHAVAGYAADNAVVHLTGNETVAGIKTLSSNPVISGGTANGVTYLNGSKVLTSGSALTFNGTNLVLGGGQRINGTSTSGLTLTSSSGVTSGFKLYNDSATDIAYLMNNYNGSMVFGVNNTEQMRLTSTGLGIGTSSPTNKLSVAGNANITGNTTLGDASTDTVTVNGYMGVGGSPNANYVLRSRGDITGGTTGYGIASTSTVQSGVTSAALGIYSATGTVDSTFTLASLRQIQVSQGTKGAASTITDQHGIYITDLTNATNNYGITSLVSSGTNKWNIYASGTAANYFAGNVGIGTSSPAYQLQIENSTGSAQMSLVASDTGFSVVNFGDQSDDNIGRIQYAHSDNSMQFLNSGGTERLRIDSAGNVGIGTSSPAVKLDVSGQIRASTGILFGTDTAAANALDDYEEGTFTPTLTHNGSTVLTVTYTVQSGRYTKIGNVVYYKIDITWTSAPTTATLHCSISGLPFSGSTVDYCPATTRDCTGITLTSSQIFAPWPTSTYVYLQYYTIGTQGTSPVTSFDANGRLNISGFYYV